MKRSPGRHALDRQTGGMPDSRKTETSMAKPKGIAPYFLVADVVKAAEHYRDKLGFTIRGYFFEDPPVFAMVGRGDDQTIMLRLAGGRSGGSNRAHEPEALDAYLW